MSEPVDNQRIYEDVRTGELSDDFYCGTCGQWLGSVLEDVTPHELRDCVKWLALQLRATEGES